MSKNEFKKLLITYMKEHYFEDYEIGVTYSSVNNEAGHECISVRRKEDVSIVTIGVSSLYEVYKSDGCSFSEITDKIMSYYDEFINITDMTGIGKKDFLFENVYCRLVNYEMNKKLLQRVPHERRLDMAVIYFMRFSLSENENAGVIIDYDRFVGKEDEELLKESAWENTMRDEPAVVCPLSDIVGSAGNDDAPVYIVSNIDKYYGAVCIYYPELLKMVAEELGSDLYILPSSIHECLVIPTYLFTDSEGLKKMVHDVNRGELKRHEILSDSVYYYNLKKDCISIDN